MSTILSAAACWSRCLGATTSGPGRSHSLASLPFEQREAVLLRVVADRPYQDIKDFEGLDLELVDPWRV